MEIVIINIFAFVPLRLVFSFAVVKKSNRGDLVPEIRNILNINFPPYTNNRNYIRFCPHFNPFILSPRKRGRENEKKRNETNAERGGACVPPCVRGVTPIKCLFLHDQH